MTINVISVGKIKEASLRSLIGEYEKRISKFSKVISTEIKDFASENSASESDKLNVINQEGQLILNKISERDYVIALAIEGDSLTSEQFSAQMDKAFISGGSKIVFIIGGSLGLSDDVKNRADKLLSFSNFTFPHQLMKLILLEQIYRAFKIKNNEPYHK